MGLFFNKKHSSDSARYTVSYDPPEQHARIVADSMKIMEQTTNPDTYFSRYKLASSEACKISDDYFGIVYDGMMACDIYYMLSDDYEKDCNHQAFIDRMFAAGKEDLITYQLYEVGGYMSEETREYFVDKLNGRKYHFCKVRFNDQSNKLYTYVTKDKGVTIGDTVTIPTGNSFVPDTKVLQVVEVFDSSLDDIPFPIENLRCVERKLKSIVCPHCGASLQVNTSEKLGKCSHCGAEFYFI